MSQPQPTQGPRCKSKHNLSQFPGFDTTNPGCTNESGGSHMKSNFRMSVSRSSWMGIALLMFALPLPALAALGGDVASVHEDQAHIKGTLTTTQAEAYTVHEIKTSANTV